MSAEDYYSGGRTEFINEFENQMQMGIYLVKRKEVRRDMITRQTAEADASDPVEQDEFGNQSKTVFIVEKRMDRDGVATTEGTKIHALRHHSARGACDRQ